MAKLVDIEMIQEALNRAANSRNHAGRFAWSNMPRVPSATMTRLEYDEKTQELDITFASGKNYRYFEVPVEIYRALREADSLGQYFNQHIRNNYEYAEAEGAK